MAMQLLERQNVYDPDLLMYRTALGMIRSASLNCYVFDVSASSHILLWYAVYHQNFDHPVAASAAQTPFCEGMRMFLRCRQRKVTPLRQGCRCSKGSWALVKPVLSDS